MVSIGRFRLRDGQSHPWILGRVGPIVSHVKRGMTGLRGKYGDC